METHELGLHLWFSFRTELGSIVHPVLNILGQLEILHQTISDERKPVALQIFFPVFEEVTDYTT